MISGYSYILNGVKFDMPFIEMIKSALPVVDEFVIVTDSRFNDGTIDRLYKLQGNGNPKLRVFVEELDLSNPGVDGATKAYARSLCKGDYLLQMDADEVLREQDYDKIRNIIKNWRKRWNIIGAGVVNWFNGPHFKLNSAGWTKERLSINSPNITHGIPILSRIMRGNIYYAKRDTDGAGYINNGVGLMSDHIFADTVDIVKDIKYNKDSIWIHHYSWYNMPRKWAMKTVWHYFWGLLYGQYKNLDDYKIDLDGNPVNFWSEPVIRDLVCYVDAIANEMKEESIIKVSGIKHPKLMDGWLKRQQVYYPKNGFLSKEVLYDGYAKYSSV